MPNPVPYDEHACAPEAPWCSAEGASGPGPPWAALLPVTQGMGHWLAIALVGSAVLRLWRSRGFGLGPSPSPRPRPSSSQTSFMVRFKERLVRLRRILRERLHG